MSENESYRILINHRVWLPSEQGHSISTVDVLDTIAPAFELAEHVTAQNLCSINYSQSKKFCMATSGLIQPDRKNAHPYVACMYIASDKSRVLSRRQAEALSYMHGLAMVDIDRINTLASSIDNCLASKIGLLNELAKEVTPALLLQHGNASLGALSIKWPLLESNEDARALVDQMDFWMTRMLADQGLDPALAQVPLQNVCHQLGVPAPAAQRPSPTQR
jgi:hypothetical protein